MNSYAYTLDGEKRHYTDHKRWLWSLSIVWALFPVSGIALHVMTGNYKSDQVHVPALLERIGQ